MPMRKDERLTLAGLHRTIGLALTYDTQVSFWCPRGSECGQFKYCSVCSRFVVREVETSEEHDAYWWMNELRKYEEEMRDGRPVCTD